MQTTPDVACLLFVPTHTRHTQHACPSKTNPQSLLKTKTEPPNNNEKTEDYEAAQAKKLQGAV